MDNDPVNLVFSAVRVGLADLAGKWIATDISDIIFGTPRLVISKANMGVLNPKKVNIIVHGHNPLLSEMEGEGISEEALAVLMQHSFPGNVRELENIIEHAFVLCKKGLIFPRHLPTHLQEKADVTLTFSSNLTLPQMEAKLILEALVRNNWKRSLTATELRIDKSTLWRKMKKLKENGLLKNIRTGL